MLLVHSYNPENYFNLVHFLLKLLDQQQYGLQNSHKIKTKDGSPEVKLSGDVFYEENHAHLSR